MLKKFKLAVTECPRRTMQSNGAGELPQSLHCFHRRTPVLSGLMSTKTIIVLRGLARTGKTGSLRELARHLLARTRWQPVPGYSSTVPAHGDFRIVVQINGKIVAIESQGDPNSDFPRRLGELTTTIHADVIFCATRTSGETVNAVVHCQTHQGYDIIWSAPYQLTNASQRGAANRIKARHLYQLVRALGIL